MAIDVERELNHCMPAANHAQLGTLLKEVIEKHNALVVSHNALITKYNAVLAKLDDESLAVSDYVSSQAATAITGASLNSLTSRNPLG